MSATPFELFGKRAQLGDFREIAARLRFQKEAEKWLLLDLLKKISPTPNDDLLEIGCGAGNLLIPLSFFTHGATGIDHEDLLKKMSERVPLDRENITLIPGNFLSVNVHKKFSKILIYSVLHYLQNETEVLQFVRKAAKLLKPGGTILIGDIPNADLKARFLASAAGKKFTLEWKKKQKQEVDSGPAQPEFRPSTPTVALDDALMKKMVQELKKQGINASVVKQSKHLAMSYTRLDIVGKKGK